MVKAGVLRAVLAGIMIATGTSPAAGSPDSRHGTLQAYALAYELQFAASYDRLRTAAAADPLDPAPLRAIAAVTWIEILFTQGTATFEAFTGEISKGDVVRPRPPAALAERFHQSLLSAKTLAERRLATVADADAYYQVGATAALSSLYMATVEGSTFGAFKEGGRAVDAMSRARALDPGKRETALLLGMSQYTVSTLSWPARLFLTSLTRLKGNRESGIKLLEEAASEGAETATDARLLLMLVDNRESRPADAVRRLVSLQHAHPGNRLLWLNQGASALAAGEPEEAEQALSKGIAGGGWDKGPAVLGEAAMWFAKRGTARARLHRRPDAVADLERGLTLMPRDWIRGRIHAELAELASAAGEPKRARQQ